MCRDNMPLHGLGNTIVDTQPKQPEELRIADSPGTHSKIKGNNKPAKIKIIQYKRKNYNTEFNTFRYSTFNSLLRADNVVCVMAYSTMSTIFGLLLQTEICHISKSHLGSISLEECY